MLTDYLRWKDQLTQPLQCSVGGEVEVQETKSALICPVSGVLMIKYRISGQTPHRIDLSHSVNGIWLDKGEWELLKQEGLVDKLNHIFTDPWQNKLRAEQTKETLGAVYAKQFGDADYTKLKEIREWLQQNPKKAYMLAYLVAENPYSA